MGKLSNKVAIVTGASSGIGEATASALAAEGMKVALMARRADRLRLLANKINSSCPGEALSIEADVTDPEAVRWTVSTTMERWGRVDVLVNNAGVMYLGPVADADVEDLRRMVDINLMGAIYMTHAVLPIMKAQGGGHLVNVSSVSGRLVSSRSAVYSATKFALNAFSDGLRQEVGGSRIRVTVVEPGAVLTELTDHIPDEKLKSDIKSWVGSLTALKSEDIAASIVYAVTQPQHVNVNEIMIRPTEQVF